MAALRAEAAKFQLLTDERDRLLFEAGQWKARYESEVQRTTELVAHSGFLDAELAAAVAAAAAAKEAATQAAAETHEARQALESVSARGPDIQRASSSKVRILVLGVG